jgi:hypothetical protein
MGPNQPHDPAPPSGAPAHPDDETFRRVVAAAFGDATALAGVTPLAGDASSRRYYRLRLRTRGEAPSTVVAMVLGADTLPLSSAELTIFDTPPTELPYVNVGRFLRSIDVPVPYLHHHDQAAGILLLEDVGDLTLWAAGGADGGARCLALYRAAIDELVRLQVRGTREADPACIAFRQRFDRRLFLWEFQHFLDYGLPERGESIHHALRAAFEPVVERLTTVPPAFAHRDFHSWNLHVHEGHIRVLDFQDALLAPPTYDLASLLTDRNTGELIDPERETVLISYYLAARRNQGETGDDPEAIRTQYFLCTLQRALKVIGRFRYLAQVKGKPGYLAYLPPVVAQARRALDAGPGLDRLRHTLLPHLSACER